MTAFVPEDLPTRPEPRTPLVQGMLFRIGAVLVLGIAGGLAWLWGTPLTSYVITEEGTATTTERGLALGASPVAAFTIIALVLGITLLAAAIYVVVNFLVDLINHWVDPRAKAV